MNDHSLLEKYTGRKLEPLPPAHDEGTDDCGAFGYLRGVRDRAIMLELRFKNGNVAAYGYAWLKQATFDASGDIVLDFSGETVRITGRNLNSEGRLHVRLLQGILWHRVPWIQEADGATVLQAAKDTIVIEGLKVS